ncbi:MAG: MCE family protein [Aeromicrobium erythreum]
MSPTMLGLVGTVVIVLVMGLVYRFDKLPLVNDAQRMTAEFTEAGGLESGDPVMVSGTKVGEVAKIRLGRGKVLVDFDVENRDVTIGRSSRASIVTLTLLGKGALKVVPEGSGRMSAGDVIPVSRTSSPYDITQALSQLTTTVDSIDVDQLTKAVRTVSGTFEKTPPELAGALDGVTKVARTIDDNDKALAQLLARARNVSGVLADRDQEIATLLRSGESLLARLNDRRAVVVSLLRSAQQLADQLTAVVRENRAKVRPALTQLNQVLDLLNRNKKSVEGLIDGLSRYTTELGEAVGSGPFFNAYIQNLTEPQTLAPVLSGLLEGEK